MTRSPHTLHYCPNCGRDAESHPILCAHCGATLVERGYCPICEAPLRAPVGGFCPKHEVELIAADEIELHGADEVETAELVTLAAFESTPKADAARIRLEAEGIPTFLDAERMGSGSFYSVATGGVKIQVPKSLETDARIILAQTWSEIPDPSLDLEEPDDWEPEPWEKRRSVMRGLLLVILFGPVLVGALAALLRRLLSN